MSEDEPNMSPQPDSSAEDSGRALGRDLAMQEILKSVLGSAITPAVTAPGSNDASTLQRPRVMRRWIAIAVTTAVVLTLILRAPLDPDASVTVTDSPSGSPAPGGFVPTESRVLPRNEPQVPMTDIPVFPPASSDPNQVPRGDSSPTAIAINGFEVLASEGAEWSRSPNGINLVRGELFLKSISNAAASDELTVETPFGTVMPGNDCSFFVGTHRPENRGSQMKWANGLTRVLIMSGMLSMICEGTIMSGTSGQLLAAGPGVPPENVAVSANNQFAFELYRELGRDNVNLFFSPYSVSSALSMAIEGARGQTAEEMARAMAFPDAALQIGREGQKLPGEFAAIHSGHQSLQKHLNARPGGSEQVRKDIDRLRAELNAANARIAELQKGNRFSELRAAGDKAEDIARRLNVLLSQIDQFELRVANAMWGQSSYPFRKSYLDAMQRFYGADSIVPVDFRTEGSRARVRINDWVSDRTNGRIPELLDAGLMSEADWKLVRLILTNAIYFRGEWSQPFSEEATEDSEFVKADGSKRPVKLMQQWGLNVRYAAFEADGTAFETPERVPAFGDMPKTYPGDDGFTMAELPYKGGQISMLILLPRSADGLPRLEAQLNADKLAEWTGRLKSWSVNGYVPRFQMETKSKLSAALKRMGMVSAFESTGQNRADFSGIFESTDPMDHLHIAEVVHAANIDVNEKGTEAAAATAVVFPAPRAAVEEVPFVPVFRADHPFLFLIRDQESGAILFLGRYAE